MDKLFIHHPLFVGELPPYGPLLKEIERRFPFDFSIARPEAIKVTEAEWRYMEILRHLKRLDTAELRLLCIARWLKQEGICEPRELLPESLFRQLLKQFAQKERISNRDVYYWRLITVWRPYFDQLRTADRELGRKNRGNKEELLKQGYDPLAVETSFTHGSIVAAIASWIDSRTDYDARTLENAYSRINAALRRDRANR